MNLTIKEAAAGDSRMIARAVILAMGEATAQLYCGSDCLKVLEEIAKREDTQYSYRHALAACVDGVPAGAIVGYDGAALLPLRDNTLAVIRKYNPRLSMVDEETEAGEFYLDSIGVLPEFRGRGIGGRLLLAMKERAFASGHERVGLLVDCENPRAERLYISQGFECVGTKLFFGHRMRHLQAQAPHE